MIKTDMRTRRIIFFKNFGGYASLFLVFLIVVILIVSGLYGWQKYEEYKYPEKAARGEIKGLSFYYNGIKERINQILEKKDIKNMRAMELAESDKTISDAEKFYTLEIPESWVIVSSEKSKGAQISKIVAQSSYFTSRENEQNGSNYIDYEKGAQFTAQVSRGENKSAFLGNGGHGSLLADRRDIPVYGQESVYHVFKEPNISNGQVIDDHVIYKGNTYLFRLVYNPDTFSDAEFSFQEILASVKFLQ